MAALPANMIQPVEVISNGVIFRTDRRDHAPFRSNFADMPALNVAGENDRRIVTEYLAIVNMTEGPVVIASKPKFLECARRITLMAVCTAQACMKQSNVEVARLRRRIARRKVLRDGSFRETLAMDRNTQIIQYDGLGLIMAQNADILRQAQNASHLVGGVMIARDDKGGDLLVPQSPKLPRKIEPGVVIAPVAIIEVAGDHDEIDPLLYSQVDQSLESPARCSSHPLHGSVFITLEPLERTVEMNVGRVKKRDRHEEETHSILRLGPSNLNSLD